MITLSLDNLTKIVATQAQADVLLKQGYSYVSGSAEGTDVSLAATTGYVKSGSGNPSYRGDGCLGELDGGLLHLLKTAMAGDNVTSDMLAFLREGYHEIAKWYGDIIPPIFTEMEAVTELPDIGEADINTLYVLTEIDGEFPVNIYAPDYDTFTPFEEFDIGRAPAAVLAQLSSAYDSGAVIIVDSVATQNAIEAEILAAIQAEIDLIDDNFTASFVGDNRWSAQTRDWTGRIKLTGKDNAAYTYTQDWDRHWRVAQDAEGVHGGISAAYNTGATIEVTDYSSKATVEAFILPLIQADIDAIDDNFAVSFVDSSYVTETHTWTGKIKVQDKDITGNSFTDATERTWTISVPAEDIHAQISAAYATGATINVEEYSSKASVEAAILPLIQAEIDAVDDNFTVSFVDSSYDDVAHTWTGKIKTQDENIASNSFTDAAARTWTITQT